MDIYKGGKDIGQKKEMLIALSEKVDNAMSNNKFNVVNLFDLTNLYVSNKVSNK
jgi:hypothetical protein